MEDTREPLGTFCVDVLGFKMHLNPADSVISPAIRRDKVWEPFETQIIMNELGKGEVVLDIGANIGYYTLLFAELVGEQGKVFAFEPDPTNFRLLQRNVVVNSLRNVTLIQKAVSDTNGKLSLYLAEHNKGDHRIYDSGDGRQSIPIESTRLDDYFERCDTQVDFIKMDIQGAEASAIRGMPWLLERSKNLRILTEFSPAGLKGFGVDPKEYLELLLKHGFDLYRIDEVEGRIQPTHIKQLLAEYGPEHEEFTNLLCIRKMIVNIDLDKWIKPDHYVRKCEAIEEIITLIPPGDTFILVDGDEWATGDLVAGRRRIPFLEQDGQYWGAPPDDKTAIRELERLRHAGASFIVFAWPAFWWLDYYSEFHRHIRESFRCVLDNDRIAVFDMRSDILGLVMTTGAKDNIVKSGDTRGNSGLPRKRDPENRRRDGDLRAFERRVFSQNGEDGILEEILRRIGVETKHFVEFGAETGGECNCARLVFEEHWRGLFIDGTPNNFARLRDRYRPYKSVRCVLAWVTSQNVEDLFTTSEIPLNFDVLSIDIDGNDYWVWSAIKRWLPRVVVIEYNASHRPPRKWVMKQNPNHQWDGTNYFGASLASLARLGKQKGYVLVATNSTGVNAFFVREDLVTNEKFLNPGVVHYLYSSPQYGPHRGGHPPWNPWKKRVIRRQRLLRR